MNRVRTGRLVVLFTIYNLGLAVAIVFSYDHTTAKMGGLLVAGNITFLPLFYIALEQTRRPHHE